MDSAVAPVVEIRGATVRFAAETALDDVSLRLLPGEVHSLMGENGAGKSTLIKALTGAQRLDAGSILVDGREVHFSGPRDAQRAGISPVYQEIDLLPNLSVAENIWLGREPRRFGLIDGRRARVDAAALLDTLGLDIDPASLLGSHPLAVQQLVAIARAIAVETRVLVLDEPTSSLDADEVAELFRVIRSLKAQGVAIVFISHFLDQVYEICDRVTVLRGGRLVGEFLTTELLRVDLVEAMLGRQAGSVPARAADRTPTDAETPVLSVRSLTVGTGIVGADLDLDEGEVLGIAGLLGSGRTELARGITGVDRPDAGELRVRGRYRRFGSPRAAMREGIVYSSENRRTEGIIADLSVLDNITLSLQAQRGILRRMSAARRRELAASWVEALHIRPTDLDRPAGTLSGGNQQKVLLARLLALSPRVIVLDEPTRGIDVGAKLEVQNLVADFAANGVSVVFISAELEEVLRVSHTIAVLREGRVDEVVPAIALTSDTLFALVAGAADEDEAMDG